MSYNILQYYLYVLYSISQYYFYCIIIYIYVVEMLHSTSSVCSGTQRALENRETNGQDKLGPWSLFLRQWDHVRSQTGFRSKGNRNKQFFHTVAHTANSRGRNERCSGYQFERLFAIAHEPVSGWEVAYSMAVYQRHRVWTKSALLRLRAMACNPNGNVDEWNLPENRVTREVSSEPRCFSAPLWEKRTKRVRGK